jgi:hypothetical protein
MVAPRFVEPGNPELRLTDEVDAVFVVGAVAVVRDVERRDVAPSALC